MRACVRVCVCVCVCVYMESVYSIVSCVLYCFVCAVSTVLLLIV